MDRQTLSAPDGGRTQRKVPDSMPWILWNSPVEVRPWERASSWVQPNGSAPGERVQDVEQLQAALRPYPGDDRVAHRVSTRVNRPAHDTPEYIAPLTWPSPHQPPPGQAGRLRCVISKHPERWSGPKVKAGTESGGRPRLGYAERKCDNELDGRAVRRSGPEAEVGRDLLDHVRLRDESDDEAGNK